jgi:hypothetical protein
VLSPDDPGIHNWLDTGGNLFGSLVGRWYRCSAHPTPTVTKIRLQDLAQHLPRSTARMTREQREAQLRIRRIGAQLRRRW